MGLNVLLPSGRVIFLWLLLTGVFAIATATVRWFSLDEPHSYSLSVFAIVVDTLLDIGHFTVLENDLYVLVHIDYPLPQVDDVFGLSQNCLDLFGALAQ